MNTQQNKALHELIQKVRLTISKPSRENDSTLIFKHLLEGKYSVLPHITDKHMRFSPPPANTSGGYTLI